MRTPLPLMDAHASYRMVEAQVEAAVKAGKLPREEAKKILAEARGSYQRNDYNRKIDGVNRVG